jgi:hypothetical protein
VTAPITDAQRRKVFGLCRGLDFDDRARREVQKEVCGKASLKKFTKADGIRLIDALVRLSGAKPKRKPVRPPKLPDNVIHFITPKQRTKIEIMAQQVVWDEEDGLERWMLKWFGFRYPRTNAEVDKVIHGLDSLKAQQKKRRREEIIHCG